MNKKYGGLVSNPRNTKDTQVVKSTTHTTNGTVVETVNLNAWPAATESDTPSSTPVPALTTDILDNLTSNGVIAVLLTTLTSSDYSLTNPVVCVYLEQNDHIMVESVVDSESNNAVLSNQFGEIQVAEHGWEGDLLLEATSFLERVFLNYECGPDGNRHMDLDQIQVEFSVNES